MKLSPFAHCCCCLVLLAMSSAAVAGDIVPFGAEWIYLSPQSEAEDPALEDGSFDNVWYQPNFTAENWSGPSAEPFAWPSPDVGAHIDAFTPDNTSFVRQANTFLPMPETEQRYSVYFRHEFSTSAPLEKLALELLADDGAAIYLDGNQVAMFNCCQTTLVGEDPFFLDLATTTGNETSYTVLQILPGEALAAGNHTLAVQVVSAATTSSDMGFSLRLLDGYTQETLIEPGGEWRFMRGESEPSGGTLDWTAAGFNDQSWSKGLEGFGYEETGAGGVLDGLVQTELDDMLGSYTTVYLRKPFSVSDPSDFDALALSVDYDDAFVAYVNGQQVVATVLDPDDDPSTPIAYDVLGQDLNADHESTNSSGAPGTRFSIDLSQYPNLLQAGGNNVLAIQGINRDPSSDFVLAQIELIGVGGLSTGGDGVAGDYNADGQLSEEDIDLLSAAIKNEETATRYDLNNDGQVNSADHTFWVEDLKHTYFGDSTLDGEFNTQDFVLVFQRGEFEDATVGNSTWSDGDWTGDGDFNTQDFVAAFQSGGFELGPRAAVAAVPEPATSTALTLGAGLLALTLRRRGQGDA